MQRYRPGSTMIEYRTNVDVHLDDVIELYVDSTLGERRPVGDRDRMERMLSGANLIITAWEGDALVGISRCITDWAYCTYLSDLAVRLDHQQQGIGKELVRLTREAAPEATVILLAAPKAVDYYPRIGMSRHESAWVLWPGETPI
ncbi:MAG: GNAT family N-acetyltransferase [Acidimicrobiia bacterium]